MLEKQLISPKELHSVYPDTVATLKTCLDDDWAPDLRLASLHFTTQLIQYLQEELDQIELSNLYPSLLTRLDDAQDPIRIQTADSLTKFLACKNVGRLR